jgi:anti-sigma regulatory factor (Ser/Thr protein kinase)
MEPFQMVRMGEPERVTAELRNDEFEARLRFPSPLHRFAEYPVGYPMSDRTAFAVWSFLMKETTPFVRLAFHDDSSPTAALRAALDDFGVRRGLPPEEIFELKVAATEALTNAIKASADGRGIEVALEPCGDTIEIEVRNRGAFELRRATRGEVDSEGGRGISLMLAFVDELEFASGREGTRVRMRKRLRRPLQPPRAVGRLA